MDTSLNQLHFFTFIITFYAVNVCRGISSLNEGGQNQNVIQVSSLSIEHVTFKVNKLGN